MSPKHSIDFCPICGGGLCGVRICGLPSDSSSQVEETATHGLVVCDECEAIWLEPDLTSDHQYASIEDARCPVCSKPLWHSSSRWADSNDLESLGWSHRINHDLDRNDEG